MLTGTLVLVEHASAEFQHLEEYLMKSHGSTHHFKYKVFVTLDVCCFVAVPGLTVLASKHLPN
jgi:hypothetical protein